jgi:hypothetical protein
MKLFGDAQLEEARSCASAVQKSRAVIDRPDYFTKKYVIF